MSTITDTNHAAFARIRHSQLVDLTSPDGPIFTFVEADGQLYVNEAALKARTTQRRASSDASAPVLAFPMVFQPAAAARESR